MTSKKKPAPATPAPEGSAAAEVPSPTPNEVGAVLLATLPGVGTQGKIVQVTQEEFEAMRVEGQARLATERDRLLASN